MPSPYLTREQAASYVTARIGVKFSANSLAQRASDHTGPPYRIWGGRGPGRGGRGRFAVYRITDLDQWIEQQFHEPASSAA